MSLDADTVMSAGSAAAARRAAGGAIAAVDAVLGGWARTAFAAVRPPGHHAEPSRPMGFCLFNNVAIAALWARHRWGKRRVAVVDFDVHHGNGTQAIFGPDAELFYGSSHQSPCYPGTGAARETGVADNVVNAPLPPGSDGAAFRAAWSERVLPALAAFAPGAADRLGRVRRAQGRSAGGIAAGDGGFRLDHRGAAGGRGRAAAFRCWKAATISTRSPPSAAAHVRVLMGAG